MNDLFRRALVLGGMVLCFSFSVAGQTELRPGFDGAEYRELLRVYEAQFGVRWPGGDRPADDTGRTRAIGKPEQYAFGYLSAEVGMRNRWALWLRRDHRVAAIVIRGTVGDPVSWLENFYAAQAPATGAFQLNDSVRFDYRLATDGRAMVHVGWLIGLAYLAPSVVTQIRGAYKAGVREYILFGHSQGGALAFLLRSYLYYLQLKGELPADILFKTYCSAAPKPGNTYYAYDYDFITRGGWGLTVVNAADWVPETPFSVQTLEDINPLNPFANIDKTLARMSLVKRWYLKGKYNKLRRRSRKAEKAYRQVLGNIAGARVRKALPGLQGPEIGMGMNYQRAGTPVVLEPDTAYYRLFPRQTQQVFEHHRLEAYDWLAAKYY
ncbi:MAG TPA: lipase family protein [Puia sp.]|nr:lipase family protein [Puia sp.]